MMRVKVEEMGSALHPDEIVVSVKTLNGTENVVVDRRMLIDSSLEVGYPIRVDGDKYLIELPRESQSGAWRVWVLSGTTSSEPERLFA